MNIIASIENLVKTISTNLSKQKLVLTTAESCTAGGLSYYLTQIPGSSSWFDRGFVTYSNIAKIEMLKIKSDTIKKHGAVSKEVGCLMAENALQLSHADLSLSITGISGPEGGSAEKPVGTVWFAFAAKGQPTYAMMFTFPGDREKIRLLAIEKALEIINEKI